MISLVNKHIRLFKLMNPHKVSKSQVKYFVDSVSKYDYVRKMGKTDYPEILRGHLQELITENDDIQLPRVPKTTPQEKPVQKDKEF